MADVWEPKVGEYTAVPMLLNKPPWRGLVRLGDGWHIDYCGFVDDVAPWLSAADQAAWRAVVRAAIAWKDYRPGAERALVEAVDALSPEQRKMAMGDADG